MVTNGLKGFVSSLSVQTLTLNIVQKFLSTEYQRSATHA